MRQPKESGSAAIQSGDGSPHSKGRVYLLAAALLWSLSGIVIKSPVIQAIPLEDRCLVLACYRALFAAVGLLPFVAWRRVRLRPRLVPSVLSFAVMNVLFVNAFTRTTAGAASCLQYTSTAWVFLFGWLVLKEKIHRGNIVALASAGCGIAWILFSEQNDQHADGNLFALGSGVAYAGVILSLRWLRDEDAALRRRSVCPALGLHPFRRSLRWSQ